MPADGSCIFCKIALREAPASVLAETDRTVAFLDIRPITPGHALVIPKAHAAFLEDLRPEDGRAIFATGQALAAALRRSGLRCEGVNFHLADGEAAGQEVFHVHLHVFPRFRGDGVGLRMGPGYGSMPSRAELDATGAAIRTHLAASPPA